MPAAERREMVLEAAAAEFAAHGLAGTSTEDVARQAGISQPYLFRLFPTKKALFLALVDRCFRRVEDDLHHGGRRLTGDEALEAMADSYSACSMTGHCCCCRCRPTPPASDPEIRDVTRAAYKKLWEMIERLTGLPFQRVVDFFAVGMLMNVAAAMDLPAVDERWTQLVPKGLATATGHSRFFLIPKVVITQYLGDGNDYQTPPPHGPSPLPRPRCSWPRSTTSW